jgi:hypothetical protein
MTVVLVKELFVSLPKVHQQVVNLRRDGELPAERMLPMLMGVLGNQVLAIDLFDEVLVTALPQRLPVIIILQILAKQTLPILLIHELVILEVVLRHLGQRVEL